MIDLSETHHKSSPEQLPRQVLVAYVSPLIVPQTNVVQSQQEVHQRGFPASLQESKVVDHRGDVAVGHHLED